MEVSRFKILLALTAVSVAFGVAQAAPKKPATAAPKAKASPTPAPVIPLPTTVEEYNSLLIGNGVSWRSGNSGYYPTFYTGFAPRVEDANRIHFHLGRGNNLRLTAPLDEYTVLTYFYGLKKRAEVYTGLVKNGMVKPYSKPQMDYYRNIVAQPSYAVLSSIDAYGAGALKREELYTASLNALKALNPGRVFDIRIDFAKQAMDWRATSLREYAAAKSAKTAILAINNLLFGRVNATVLSASQTAKLDALVANAPMSDESFVQKTAELFNDVTAGRYKFRTVVNGQFRNALECSPAACTLSYSEFTSVYPNGSVIAFTNDKQGNRINLIAENGVMHFVDRSYGDVDLIRKEQYYGWMPKMDYTEDGNGIHNPAVRTWLDSRYKWAAEYLKIPKTDDTLWIVSRGAVSHGCTRMAAGHLWEVRAIFPSNPASMPKVLYTGNSSTDYDIFDIDGDGTKEVMGTDYLIAYALKGNSGDGYREANGLISASFKKDEFYNLLYGSRGQFYKSGDQYVFTNPQMSYFMGATDGRSRAKPFSVVMNGEYKLYEQAYEKDKVQLYDIPKYGISALKEGSNTSNRAQQFVRLMGRINACGPFAQEYAACGQQVFENEMKSFAGGN